MSKPFGYPGERHASQMESFDIHIRRVRNMPEAVRSQIGTEMRDSGIRGLLLTPAERMYIPLVSARSLVRFCGHHSIRVTEEQMSELFEVADAVLREGASREVAFPTFDLRVWGRARESKVLVTADSSVIAAERLAAQEAINRRYNIRYQWPEQPCGISIASAHNATALDALRLLLEENRSLLPPRIECGEIETISSR